MAEQVIMHGKKLNTATPDEVARIIAAAFGNRQSESYTREKGAVGLDGNGNASQSIGAVPAGYDWLCQRITIVGKAGAEVDFFENSTTGSDLLETITIGANGKYSDSFDNVLYVPANSQLILVVANGDVNGSVSYNLQIRIIERPQHAGRKAA